MWLFTGRYAQFGPAVWAIALIIATIGVVFIILAARLVRRREVNAARAAAAILAVTAAAAFSEAQAFGEPVFVANGLNRGAALLVAIVGVSLGAAGVFVSRKRRLLGVLLLLAASGVLFGDLVGWVRRSRSPTYRVEAHTLPVRLLPTIVTSEHRLDPAQDYRMDSSAPSAAQQRLQPAGPYRMMARG